MPKMPNLALSAFALLVVTGCATNQQSEEDIYLSSDAADLTLEPPAVMNARISHIVTFDFDSAQLPFDAAEVVEPHARHLIANPNTKVILQGSASSEGGSSYNYRLGMKRSKAVKSLLLELGVNPQQIVTLSVGERYSKFQPNRSVLIGY
ncbi:Peptidoglycan-associated lipoprotein [Alteromonas macleodii]